MDSRYRTRIRKALSLLEKGADKQMLVVSSNAPVTRSRDTHYHFRQNSDLYYLTGSLAEDVTLVLRPNSRVPIVLLAPPRDPVKKLWEGAQPSLGPLARELGADLIISKDHLGSLSKLAHGYETVYLHGVHNTVSAAFKLHLAHNSSYGKRGMPRNLMELESLTSQLRSIKESHEVALIRKSAELTGTALKACTPLIAAGRGEHEIGALIEYTYRAHGADTAFNSIVGAGASAATLHYKELSRRLRNGEMLLIDTGAERQMYASDVTRTLFVGANREPAMAAIHAGVQRAQRAAIQAVRPGAFLPEVYRAAATELTKTLIDLKVLRGSVAKLLKDGSFKPWFPHGIGHLMGIDVHDVTPAHDEKGLELKAGMVLTIEPGLYFPKKVGLAPACGVRIEDDILVTKTGCENLTEGLIPEIEPLA